MVDFEAHTLLAQVVPAEAEALLGTLLGCGIRTEAARVGTALSFELNYFGAQRSEQHAREFSTLVAAFENHCSGKRGT